MSAREEPAQPAEAAGPSAREKRLTLIAAIMGSVVVTVDATVVNVALPAIERELGGGLAGQQWTANAYLLTLASLILIGGSLGDLFGERRVFVAGVAGFGITSILCAIAPTIELLVVARGLQGIAGALLTPTALAVIVATFSVAERGKAVGQWTAWGGIGVVLGPMVGGLIIDNTSWRWIFAINVPVVLLTLALARAIPGRVETSTERHVDFGGALLCALGLAGVTFALIQQPMMGWSHPGVAGPLVVGLLIFGAFLVFEARARAPMLPLGMFRRRNFSVGNIETFAMYAGLSLMFFFLTIFLQEVAGYSALQAGSATVPVTVVMFLLSSRFGALADRIGPRLFMGTGPLLAAVGFLLMLRLDERADYLTELLPALLVFALALSMTVAPLTSTVLADAEESNAGIASAVNNAIARTAGLLATAAVGAAVASVFGAAIDERLGGRSLAPRTRAAVEQAKTRPLATVDPESVPAADRRAVSEAATEASISAFHSAMTIGAVLLALGGLMGFVGIRDPRDRRSIRAEECPGGQLAGAPRAAAGCGSSELHGAPATAGAAR